MFARILNYYNNAKWVKWIEVICFLTIGLFLIIQGYSFLQDELGNNKGLFYVIAGSFWVFCAGLAWVLRYLSEIGQWIATIIQTLLIIVAVVLKFMA